MNMQSSLFYMRHINNGEKERRKKSGRINLTTPSLSPLVLASSEGILFSIICNDLNMGLPATHAQYRQGKKTLGQPNKQTEG